MDRKEFIQHLKDLMPHIYDFAVLETHPLALALNPPTGYKGSRGEYLQHLVYDTIERMQPAGTKLPPNSVEWRPYLILHQRYVDGLSIPDLSSNLCLGERQVRRDHSRALEALASRIWDQAFKGKDVHGFTVMEGEAGIEGTESARTEQMYDIHQELLDLNTLVSGVAVILRRRLQDEDVELQIDLSSNPPQTLGDRVIARQILIGLFNYAMHLQSGKTIRIRVTPEGIIEIETQVDADWNFWRNEVHEASLESVNFWIPKMHAALSETFPPEGEDGRATIRLALLRADQGTILVVDDQEPAVRMFQRYLSHTSFKIIGITDPAQVLAVARQIQPVLITLDVMMPRMDGWETLQALQLNPETRHIPVVICSAWEEPELAKSLGAVEYLKKPVTQKDLLGVLEQLHLSE